MQLGRATRTSPSQCVAARKIHRSAVIMAAVKDINSASEALDLLQKQGYEYLDVRTVEEFQAGHAPGAVNIPVMVRGPGGEHHYN